MTCVRIHIDSIGAELEVAEEELVIRNDEDEGTRIRRILDRALRKVEAAYGLTPATTDAPHPDRPAGLYQTMEIAHAAQHYGFPIPKAVGEEWMAPDGSIWTFALTGTAWWEISSYAPDRTPDATPHRTPPPGGAGEAKAR